MLGQVLQARGGAWSESGEVEAPGAGRRGMAVVGTTEKEPRVLVASSAGQEPAWGGGAVAAEASEAAGIESRVGLQSLWWLCGSMCRARFRGVLSAEMDGAW